MLTTISVKVFINSVVICILSSIVCKVIDIYKVYEKSRIIKGVMLILLLTAMVSAFIVFISFFCVLFGTTYNFIF